MWYRIEKCVINYLTVMFVEHIEFLSSQSFHAHLRARFLIYLFIVALGTIIIITFFPVPHLKILYFLVSFLQLRSMACMNQNRVTTTGMKSKLEKRAICIEFVMLLGHGTGVTK